MFAPASAPVSTLEGRPTRRLGMALALLHRHDASLRGGCARRRQRPVRRVDCRAGGCPAGAENAAHGDDHHPHRQQLGERRVRGDLAGAGARGAHQRPAWCWTCEIDRYGLAEWCKVASESPEKFGRGAAAMALRPTLKIQPAKGPDGPVDQVMNIAIEFTAPDLDIDWGAARAGGAGAANPTIFGGHSSLSGKAVCVARRSDLDKRRRLGRRRPPRLSGEGGAGAGRPTPSPIAT